MKTLIVSIATLISVGLFTPALQEGGVLDTAFKTVHTATDPQASPFQVAPGVSAQDALKGQAFRY